MAVTSTDSKAKRKDLGNQTAEEFFALMHERYEEAVEAWRNNRAEAHEDLQFIAGQQWDERIRAQREAAGRPALRMNLLRKFVKRVVGDIRANRPMPKTKPVDEFADVQMAENLNHIMRHIEIRSGAEVAMDTAAEHAVGSGFGFFYITSEYPDDAGFEQELAFRRVMNNLAVLLDPNAQGFCNEDGMYAFIEDYVKDREYEQQYGDVPSVDFPTAGLGTERDGWFVQDKKRIALYYYVELEDVELALMADGRVLEWDDETREALERLGEFPERTRKAKRRVVRMCKVSGDKILEGPTEIPGPYIPVVPIYGDEIYVDGERKLISLIRDAKDTQVMFNYFRSLQTELVSMSPKAPYLVTDEQVKGKENLWNKANVDHLPYLPYNVDPEAPNLSPKREAPPQVPAGVVQAGRDMKEDLQGVLGMTDRYTGGKGNERSAKAIQMLNANADQSNFSLIDNVARAAMHAARILIHWIPKVYDTERLFRITGDDGELRQFWVNRTVWDPVRIENVVINDLSVGRYDVIEVAGSWFRSRRDEQVAAMIELLQYLPNTGGLISDYVVEAMDFPKAKEAAQRLKRALPPQITGEAQPGAPGMPPGGPPGGPEQLTLPAG